MSVMIEDVNKLFEKELEDSDKEKKRIEKSYCSILLSEWMKFFFSKNGQTMADVVILYRDGLTPK